MKFLIAGWFSFEQMGATAGDLLTRDLVCDWLKDLHVDYEVALAHPFDGGVDWQTVNPEDYSHLIFVCGPFGNGWPITEFLPRFSHCRMIGLNLSMLESLDIWNPFALLLERDSSFTSRPDMAFLSKPSRVPVVGVILVHPQKEYRSKARHEEANAALQRLVASQEISAVPIDTRLDENSTGLRTALEVESLIARMDLVLTTRLHGTVLALKNGVPAIAIDPIAGGAKILRQAETIGWPVVFTADTVTDDALQRAFEYCLTESAKTKAQECSQRARQKLTAVYEILVKEILDN